MPLGIRGGAVKRFDFLAQFPKRLSGQIRQGDIVRYHRGLANRRDEPVDQCHVTTTPKLADESLLDLAPFLLEIVDEPLEGHTIRRFDAAGLALEVGDLDIQITSLPQLAA